MAILSYAELERITNVSYKTIRRKLADAQLKPFTTGGKGKPTLFDSRYALEAIMHPRPQELDFFGCEEGEKTEWRALVLKIKAIFLEIPLEISRLSDDPAEQDRMFEASRHLFDEALRALDDAARL